MAEQGTVLFEDHAITYLNFEGRAGVYNAEGARNFCVILTPEEGAILTNDGWNVKISKPREEEEDPIVYIQVSLSWKFKPPVVVMLTSKGRTILNENMISILDAVDIAKVDVIMRPYDYSLPTGSGRKAYLKTMFVTIDEDELMMKYGFEPGPIADEADMENV